MRAKREKGQNRKTEAVTASASIEPGSSKKEGKRKVLVRKDLLILLSDRQEEVHYDTKFWWGWFESPPNGLSQTNMV